MPLDIEGWLEGRLEMFGDRDDGWQAVVSISSLVGGGDEVAERLFGLSKRFRRGEAPVDALAANRGVPAHPSAEVRAELEQLAAHERQYGAGEFGGFTHATWAEVAAHVPALPTLDTSDWRLVFELAERLAESRFSKQNLRFVVWFNW